MSRSTSSVSQPRGNIEERLPQDPSIRSRPPAARAPEPPCLSRSLPEECLPPDLRNCSPSSVVIESSARWRPRPARARPPRQPLVKTELTSRSFLSDGQDLRSPRPPRSPAQQLSRLGRAFVERTRLFHINALARFRPGASRAITAWSCACARDESPRLEVEECGTTPWRSAASGSFSGELTSLEEQLPPPAEFPAPVRDAPPRRAPAATASSGCSTDAARPPSLRGLRRVPRGGMDLASGARRQTCNDADARRGCVNWIRSPWSSTIRASSAGSSPLRRFSPVAASTTGTVKASGRGGQEKLSALRRQREHSSLHERE